MEDKLSIKLSLRISEKTNQSLDKLQKELFADHTRSEIIRLILSMILQKQAT